MRIPSPVLIQRAGALSATFALLAFAGSARAQRKDLGGFPSDSAIRVILQARVDAGISPGLVVGILQPNGHRRSVAVGSAGAPAVTLNASTVFEIGSVTKVFTGTLLARMVLDSVVALDEPVAELLPDSVAVPERNGRKITLLDLATQSSGLPRLPGNLHPADPSNPYADYSVGQLYEFLSGYQLDRDPGRSYEYSNLGMGLLGFALGQKAGSDYAAALRQRVLDPLELKDTRIDLSPSMRQRLAQGHGPAGFPVANWDIPTLAGAGALRSTANDMLSFLAANLDSAGPIGEAAEMAREPLRPAGAPRMRIGLAWHILHKVSRTIVWHNGETGGYHSFIGFDPDARRGVVVLSNSATSIDDIGMHLLDPSSPLTSVDRPVAVDTVILESYVGTYQFTPQFSIEITRSGSSLFARATGQARLPIFPRSQTDFYLREIPASITFHLDSLGAVVGLVLHQNGNDVPGRKVQ
jgi:CubicO group peptidase (beta-lactamase class C family)